MKSMIVAIQPKWLKLILDGTKKFEFRNWKVPVGTVIYFYCSKGKPILYHTDGGYADNVGTIGGGVYEIDGVVTLDDIDKMDYLLNGKVVAKAVVKDILDLQTKNSEGKKIGLSKFLPRVAFKSFATDESLLQYLVRTGCDLTLNDNNKITAFHDKYALELEKVQEIEPRDITEFVSWNKLEKAYDDRVKWCYQQGLFPPMTREQWMAQANCIDEETLEQCKLKVAPQSRVWIYEEENNET